MHTDAAQMIGKGRVDVQELGVDYLTIVGHKVWLGLFTWPRCRSPSKTFQLGCQGDFGCPPQLDTSSVAKIFLLVGALRTVFSQMTRLL